MKHLFHLVILASILLSIAHATPAKQCRINVNPDGSQTDTCPYLFECINSTCVHVSLFPLQPIEIAGLVLIIFITGLASSGGNGGGTILTPILLIFFHFTESNAIMIVYSMIFGGAIGNFLNTGLKRSRKTGKPYLNYDLCLICMPPMLFGTSVGIILNRMVAPIVVVVGLVALTLYTLIRISRKARTEYAKESIMQREDKLLAEEGLLNSYSESTDTESTISHEELEEIHNEESKLFPPAKVFKILGLLGFMLLLVLLRGTLNFNSIVGIQYCSVEYWSLFGVGFVVCAICFYINQTTIKSTLKRKETLRYSIYKKEEFEIKPQHITKLLILSLIAGVLAGMFGIGGGTIMSPSLLSIGVKAQALSATSGFFVLQTSFMSLITAILYKEVPIYELGFFFGVSCIGSFGVSYIINKLVKRYQRPSLILFILLFVFFLSLFATPAYEIVHNLDDLGSLLVFDSIC